MIKKLLNLISSSVLAITLVLLVMLFSLAGAILPQQGKLSVQDIAAWQEDHSALTSIFEPIGLFHVFHSWPFIITILALSVNTLTCTILCFRKEGGFSALKGPNRIRLTGFLLLHISLILLFTGGFLSATVKLDGFIVLTEGQSFKEQHEGYLWLVEGPLRRERHEEFVVKLKDVNITYERKKYQTDVTCNLEILLNDNKVTDGIVKVNKPFTYKGLSFTQDKTGFSPHLMISDNENGREMVNSFVALKTFQTADGRDYRDFLPLPFLENTVVITLYPDFAVNNDRVVKTSEEPDNPLLIVQVEDETGNIVEQKRLPLGKSISLGKYSLHFDDLRQWSSFRIVDDPGYPVVCVAFGMALVALLLRYVPDIAKWLAADSSIAKAADS